MAGATTNADAIKIPPRPVVFVGRVLHHTGALKQAIRNVVPLAEPNGQPFLPIYNDHILLHSL